MNGRFWLALLLMAVVAVTGCSTLPQDSYASRAREQAAYHELEPEVVRGQFRPLTPYQWFEQHPLFGYCVGAAVIAVPIVVITHHNEVEQIKAAR